ncbi:MAG: tetratricopeptide repeat protein [Saprospiraceae bacterium]|nr:tetratricopeptide repeat protein [Saprospiraceae bacterium]
MTRYFYLAILMICTGTGLMANDLAINFSAAVDLYNEGKYTESIAKYEAILTTGIVSAELYNNLGLAYHKNGELGKAIVNFNRALRQSSSNEDAKHNLVAARQQVEEQTIEIEDTALVRIWNGVAGSLSANGWGVVFLLFLCFGACSLSFWQIGKTSELKRRGFWGGIVVLSLSILPLIWGFQQRAVELDSGIAIIIKEKVGIREAPNLGSEEIELVFEGNTVQVLTNENNWTKVRLTNGLLGWLPSTMIEKV